VGLAGVIIAMELEHRFGIKIPDADAQRLTTPREITQYLYDRTREAEKPLTIEEIGRLVQKIIAEELGLDMAEVFPDAHLVRDLGMDTEAVRPVLSSGLPRHAFACYNAHDMTQAVHPITPTPDEVLRAQNEGGVEFVNGQLVEKPVSLESSRVAARIVYLLNQHVQRTGEAIICDSSLGYQCFAEEPARYRKPDVSAIRRERLAGLDPDPGLMLIPADLVVEVISPGDTVYDVSKKIEEYLENGFKLIWVVHPNTKTVVIHRADGSVGKLHEDDEIVGESVLPSFKCQVAEFFAQPAPSR
jgi:Uma2 family endonuclease/acyl carrier protein